MYFNFNEAIGKLESGEWESATTETWKEAKARIKISIKKYKDRKVLQLTHRDGTDTYWQITSGNIFDDRYMDAS